MPQVKKIPMRRCVACGERKEKKDLVRVVHTPEDQICFDPSGRMNGRGAYLCKDPNCLQKAKKSKALERSLKTSITEEVYEALGKELIG